MISKEIEELTRERLVIEAEVSQKEADIRIKTGEMRSLQSELDTLTATLKQLETQRGEAQKRLDDLKAQVRLRFPQFSIYDLIFPMSEESRSRELGKVSAR
jgi:chromosome segregation ATPase